MGIRISKDHLHPSVIESITSLIGDLNQLETTAKGNAVEAINELLANGGNKEELEALIAEIADGRELIANAVGEPLTAEESFDEMSNDINGLLATFKTNMMNNGVTVESGDRFKSLIDKIATMVEEGSGKGIQFAEGTQTFTYNIQAGRVLTVNTNLNFTPTHVFATFTPFSIGSLTYRNYIMSNIFNFSTGQSYVNRAWISEVTSEYFKISTTDDDDDNSYITYDVDTTIKWWAIGVGEEDTTLRDSLADILENKGVDVTEEDDMASLITKVDSISGGLDIISATELPATGKENQICVITDVEPSNFIITTDFTDVDFTSNDIFVYQGTSIAKDLSFGTKVAITNDKVTNNQYFCKVCQGTDRLDSYIYQNNLWNQLTVSKILLYENYKFYNSSVFGSITSSQSTAGEFYWDSSTHITRSYNGSYYASKVFNKKIDFSLYNKIEVLAYKNHSDSTSLTFGANKNATASGGTSMPTLEYSKSITISSTSIKSYEYDISSWTGEYYLTMVGGRAGGFVITAIYIY